MRQVWPANTATHSESPRASLTLTSWAACTTRRSAWRDRTGPSFTSTARTTSEEWWRLATRFPSRRRDSTKWPPLTLWRKTTASLAWWAATASPIPAKDPPVLTVSGIQFIQVYSLHWNLMYFAHRTLNVTYNADGSCSGGWICEHRWSVMKKMVFIRYCTILKRRVVIFLVNRWPSATTSLALGRCTITTTVTLSPLAAETWAISPWLDPDSPIYYFRLVNFSWIAPLLLIFVRQHALNMVYFSKSKFNYQCIINLGLPDGTYCNIIDDCRTSLTVDGGKGQVVINNTEEPLLVVCNGECYRDFDMMPATTTPEITTPLSLETTYQ